MRKIEGSLMGMLFVVLELAVLLSNVTLVADEGTPNGLGVLGIVASPLTATTGVVYHTAKE